MSWDWTSNDNDQKQSSAGAIVLDILDGVLQVPISTDQNIVLPHVGVALTGLFIIPGINPTYGATQLLQEVKKLRTAENVGS